MWLIALFYFTNPFKGYASEEIDAITFYLREPDHYLAASLYMGPAHDSPRKFLAELYTVCRLVNQNYEIPLQEILKILLGRATHARKISIVHKSLRFLNFFDPDDDEHQSILWRLLGLEDPRIDRPDGRPHKHPLTPDQLKESEIIDNFMRRSEKLWNYALQNTPEGMSEKQFLFSIWAIAKTHSCIGIHDFFEFVVNFKRDSHQDLKSFVQHTVISSYHNMTLAAQEYGLSKEWVLHEAAS